MKITIEVDVDTEDLYDMYMDEGRKAFEDYLRDIVGNVVGIENDYSLDFDEVLDAVMCECE